MTARTFAAHCLAAAALATGALAATSAPTTAADGLLQAFVGKWEGRGQIFMEPGADPRSAFCRVTGQVSQNGEVLEQQGRCAAGEDTRSITARVEHQGGGFYVGDWDAGFGTSRVSGTADGNRIELVVSSGGGIPQGASPTITLTVGRDAYIMEMTGVDPNVGRFNVGKIAFTKE